MATLNEPQFKHLSADGAVTTDGKAGILHYAIFSGATVGDKCVIKDGASAIFTLITSVANAPVILDFLGKDKARPVFETDIDVDLTLTGTGFLTAVYEEIEE